jgi:eukaryotic-like serine/threonine-protein kinase
MLCSRCQRDFAQDHRFCPYDGEPLSSPLRELPPLAPSARKDTARDSVDPELVLGSRYRIRGFIGKGGMARVYLAEDLQSGAPVAVKVLDNAHAVGSHARNRFLREAKAVSRIGHENIVKILDLGLSADGAPYLVLEFLDGESLGQRLRRDPLMTPAVALPALRQMASGLAAAHRAGIIHRDVKPDNVFLLGEPPYTVKLLDFGLAKLDTQSSFTKTGVAVGTLDYMAPEQVVTDRPDARTDVYGLGVLMYRMLTGQMPFRAKEDTDLLARHLLLPVPPPSLDVDGIDFPTELVVLTALRKSPNNRYASMDDFGEDIDRLLGERGGPLVAERLGVEPDVYVPKSFFAKNAALFFYQKLGMAPPDWDD